MHDLSIHLRGVAKSFHATDDNRPTVHAVDGIDLDIRPGEVVALLGPNGAGKTTTLDMVLGFTEPTAGMVQVFGTSPRDAIAAGKVAAVLQTGGLLRDLTVGETVELIASTHENPMSPSDAMERAGIAALAGRLVEACSGGEQQRLRYALALLGKPELLILDEPTTGMDVETRREFWSTMHDEADQGRTIVFATHYLQEAEDFAERTVLMANGRIVADGQTDEIRRRATGKRVRARFDRDPGEVIDQIRLLDGVSSVRADRQGIIAETSNSDELARLILGPLHGFDLEIQAASLENAFVQLTTTPELEPR